MGKSLSEYSTLIRGNNFPAYVPILPTPTLAPSGGGGESVDNRGTIRLANISLIIPD